MIELSNERLQVKISKLGAELQSLFSKENSIEYLWQGDPSFWAKRSPVLFPIVGTLKGNEYTFSGKSYTLGRHGFARDMEFQVYQHGDTSVSFRLDSNERTNEKYPFAFRFVVNYTLYENELAVEYVVGNKGDGDMFFSVGAHPAFRVPQVKDLAYEDYYLEFSEVEDAPRWPISNDGLIENNPVELLKNTARLDLSKELFAQDALVFKNIRSKRISLRSEKSPHGLDFFLQGFPYLGLWAAPKADFVCIEPWCGIADGVDSDQQFPQKEGINRLGEGEQFARTWKVNLF